MSSRVGIRPVSRGFRTFNFVARHMSNRGLGRLGGTVRGTVGGRGGNNSGPCYVIVSAFGNTNVSFVRSSCR